MPAFFAAPEPRPSKHDFIGQVFTKASPILTWRPTKVQRIKLGQTAAEAPRAMDPSEASFNPVTFSRATTRRMVSWPVVPELPRARGRAVRALLTLVTFSLLCGSALTLCVYLLLGESSVASRASAPASRVAVAHVEGKSIVDTLSSPPEPVLAAPQPSVPARTAARPHQNHARAPQHAQPLHAQHSTVHAAHKATPGHRAT
jgi:hypothetical protein